MVSGTGLGNPDEVLLDNKGTLDNEFAVDALLVYFDEEEGFDFQIKENSISIGIEPSYQYDRLKIIHINKNKSKSYIQYGKAWGPYGSQIGKNTRLYGEYKTKSKFVRFVDKWHAKFFGSVK